MINAGSGRRSVRGEMNRTVSQGCMAEVVNCGQEEKRRKNP